MRCRRIITHAIVISDKFDISYTHIVGDERLVETRSAVGTLLVDILAFVLINADEIGGIAFEVFTVFDRILSCLQLIWVQAYECCLVLKARHLTHLAI